MGEWRRVKIGDVARHRKVSITISDDVEYKLCRVQLHRRGVVLREKLPGAAIKTKKQQVCKAGDLIVAEMDAKFGGYGFIGEELDGAIVSSHYYLYELDPAKISKEYFLVLIHSGTIQSQIEAKGSTNYSSIRGWEFLDYEILLPSLECQHQIASRFNTCFSAVNTHDLQASEQLSLLKQLRQAVLQEAVEGKLTAAWRTQHPVVKGDPQFDAVALLAQIRTEKERLVKEGKIRKEKPLPPIADDDKPFDLPDGWVWCRLGDVADGFQYGSSAKSIKDGKSPVLRMGNIQGGQIDWTDLVYTNDKDEAKKYSLTEGDLLFNRTNSRELVGKTALFDGRREALFAGYLVRVSMLGKISPTYSNFVLNSKHHREWCDENKTDALGQSNINATKLRDFLFPLPPLAEQQAIVSRVDSLMAVIDELEKQIAERKEQAQQLMQMVLREAFDGGATCP